jgi:hypothetical protein
MNANQEWIKASKKWIKNAKLSIESNLLERDLLKEQNAINIERITLLEVLIDHMKNAIEKLKADIKAVEVNEANNHK